MSADTAYDTVAYPSHPCPQAHPDRLAMLGRLFGMTPAPVEDCRVLELGCGEGGNLIPLAFALPRSKFVGIDLAGTAIAKAHEESRALGLENVEFHCADLLEWTPADGPFDYVIAHGLFSWVPEAVRLRALELCRDRLAPQGVAFISYNALPGCHIRGMLWEMLHFHTRPFPTPGQKIDQARALLRLLLATPTKESAYAALLKSEAERLLDRQADPILFHDDLAEINQPFYFHEFAALAGQYGLQFLAEADFFEMHDLTHPPAVAEALQQFSGNLILKEQYLDFLKCRRFRQTLLCRDEVRLNRQVQPAQLRNYLIASETKPMSASPDLGAAVVERFIGPRGVTMQVDHPLIKAGLLELLAVWPRALPFAELVQAARTRLGRPRGDAADAEADFFAEVLLAAYSMGLIELHIYQQARLAGPGEQPTASPLVRRQLELGREIVTTVRHTNARVDVPLLRETLLLLDGTRDVPAVEVELRRRIDAGQPELPAGATRENLHAEVENAVRDAAGRGLLIAW